MTLFVNNSYCSFSEFIYCPYTSQLGIGWSKTVIKTDLIFVLTEPQPIPLKISGLVTYLSKHELIRNLFRQSLAAVSMGVGLLFSDLGWGGR